MILWSICFRDYAQYTGGLSEEEQVARAMENSWQESKSVPIYIVKDCWTGFNVIPYLMKNK